MASFAFADASVTVTDEIAQSQREAWAQLGQPGSWWTGAERLAIATRARQAFSQRATPPWSRELPPEQAGLSVEAVAVVDQLALDAGKIDSPWAFDAITALGDGHYVELIAVVAVVVMVDIHAAATGAELEPFPTAADGQPTGGRPEGLGDIGAHVPVLDPFPFANVARALSLVPDANALFRMVSVPTYSAPGFADLAWETPLSRPQVELVASRVAAMNECFY